MEFYQLISLAHLNSAGCWKAAGDQAGVRTLSCGEGCFCPCGTEQENLKYRSQGSSCCSLWPTSPVQKVNAEEVSGGGVSIIFKICYYQVLFSPKRIFGFTELRKLISFFKKGTILPFSLQSKLVNQHSVMMEISYNQGIKPSGVGHVIVFSVL